MTISPETTRLDPGSKSDWPCTISSGRRLCSRKVRRDSTSHSAHCRSNWRAAPGRCHRRRRLPRRRSTRPRRLLRAERCVAPCMMRAFSLRTAHFTVWKSDITGSDGGLISTPPLPRHRRRCPPRGRPTRPRGLLRPKRCVAPCMMRASSLRTAHFTVWKSELARSDGGLIPTPPSLGIAGAARRAADRPDLGACCDRLRASTRPAC